MFDWYSLNEDPIISYDAVFQNLYVLQKIGAEKVQWAQHFINRGFVGEFLIMFFI